LKETKFPRGNENKTNQKCF